MIRIGFLVAAIALVSGCSTQPLVTRERMTLAEANIEGMECRRQLSVTSSIPKTICASPDLWKRFDDTEATKSAAFFDDIHDNADNRMLYRNR